MRVDVQAYWLPKAGNALEEYEDAFWQSRIPTGDADFLRLAVADGATETSFSRSWALLLAKAYCRGRLAADNLQSGLPKLQRIWKRHVGKKPLPWYAEQKLESGAFAAIAGIKIGSQVKEWSAFAVGDCCVFHTREEVILTSFPMDHAEQFNNRPLLLSSVASNNLGVVESVKCISGTWVSGDTFYLMSDALAAWFLRYASLPGGDAAYCLRTLTNQRSFADFVELQRNDVFKDGEPMMRNDDVTLLACTIT